MKRQQHRNKPLVTTPMKPEIITRIAELAVKYNKKKTNVIGKALEMGLNELELYYQMEQKFFTNQKKKIDKRIKELNKTSDEESPAKNLPQNEVAQKPEGLVNEKRS
jgi:predicted DNA-binding protein